MKLLSNALLIFNVQQGIGETKGVPGWLAGLPFLSPLESAGSNASAERMESIENLLEAAKEVGQVGSLASEEDQKRMEDLAAKVIPYSDSRPARFPLEGEHRLIYSAAPGASSGRVFGNVVGSVSQFFADEETFYNRVSFGPLQIALRAKRDIKSDSVINVSFQETTFSLFGQPLKTQTVGGGGTWKVKFVGRLPAEEEGGKDKLLRVMETPSLFILEQTIE